MKGMRYWYVVFAPIVLFFAACQGEGQNAETVDIPEDPRGIWYVNDPASTATIDHSVWDKFLQTYHHENPYGDGVNRIAYARVTDDDHSALRQYIRTLSRTPIATYNRDEQIAFWMNLYNAAIINMVLDNQPVNSVLQIRGPGINVVGPWLTNVATVHGKNVSFNDIEHYILRAAFDDMDPPVHYGLNCASIGCPPIAPRAHTAENWRENLAKSARQFVNSEQGLRVENGELFTSKVYHSWFKEDFGGTDTAVLTHVKEYCNGTVAAALEGHTEIAGDYYDWRLNKMEEEAVVGEVADE